MPVKATAVTPSSASIAFGKRVIAASLSTRAAYLNPGYKGNTYATKLGRRGDPFLRNTNVTDGGGPARAEPATFRNPLNPGPDPFLAHYRGR